ncbi:hypothetical protein SAMN04489716_3519 [Actinoplanes derwentensis]|uniref:Uncharacterized protein n=2 Tax=Actinoplanes derwentensis TaxID=113562 RepID=A0A1H1ZVS5_9ACTN|nr:hypothetical protein SAMN04489716_3519 [Actinoplanes derwentensis]
MSDYGVGWPLWEDGAMDPADFDLPVGLADRISAWQEHFEVRFHYEDGWKTAEDAAAYAREGRELHRFLEQSIGGWADVRLDLWPVQ